MGKLSQSWPNRPLGTLATIQSGGTPDRKNSAYWVSGEIPWVTTAEVNYSLITDTKEKITPAGLANSSAKIFPKGTILMALYGQGKTRGQVGLLGIDASTNQACAAIQPGRDLNVGFLYEYLKASYAAIRRLSNSGSQQNLSSALISEIQIPIPPLPEQCKIAEILQTWGEAIEKLEALRMAKRRIRNQVLTKILENPAWPLIPLSEIGEISGAGVDKKTIPGEEPVRLVNFLDVLQRDFLFDAEITHRVTASARQMKRCGVRRGDVFFTPSSETQDEIACSAVAMEDMPATVYSYHILRLRFLKEVDLHFRAYLFKSSHFLKQAFRLCAGSGQRYVLSQDQFRRMTIFLPSLEEQRFIGNCLWAMDQEIALIGRKIKALTHQKRGLAQKLLAGEWRVVHTQPFPSTDNRKDECSD